MVTDESPIDLATTDAVFLGAGFSRAATNDESPLMSDFFGRLDRRKYWQLWRFLEEISGSPTTANVESALLYLDQLSSSPLHGVEPFFDQCRARHREVRRELDQYTIERLGSLKIEANNWACNVLARASETTTVITTNYDTVADRILSNRQGIRHRTQRTNCHHCKLCRILEDECASGPLKGLSDRSWRGSLLKIHGSISWRRCSADACCSSECLLPDKHCRPFNDDPCPTCGEHCSPVLVPPSMVKSFDAFPGLKRVWNATFQALSHAKSILFFGFSFPSSDALINELFRASFKANPRRIEISIVDIEPEKPGSILEELLGSEDESSIIRLFQVPPDGAIPQWLMHDEPENSRSIHDLTA